MSLVTRCPQCRTLFRVQPEQLDARGGRVRCGRCMIVFDGLGALAEQPDSAVEPPRSESSPAAPAAVPPRARGTPEGAAPSPASATPVAASAASPPPAEPGRPLLERVRELSAPLAHPTPRARRVALCALLALVLTAQLAYAMRSELAARSAVMKGAFEGLCGFTGCTLALPQRPDLVKIEASDVHMVDAARPQLIQLTATLRSYAGHDVAYPALDLVLTNANEHALARRIFLPADYLDAARDPAAGLAPRAEITVALDLDTGDLNAAGFRLDLVAAPAPGTPR